MALAKCRDLWRGFINAAYLPKIEAQVKCQDCQSKRSCNNHYCLACKEGGLCPTKFKANQPHDHHPYLQVRQLTYENVVNVDELEAFLGANAHKIQKFRGNNKDTVKLKMSERSEWSKAPANANIKDNIICGGCNVPFTKTSKSQEGAIVCSIECLIIYAEQNHQMDLLKLKDGVELERHDYVYPMMAQEKIDFKLHSGGRSLDVGRNWKKNSSVPSRIGKEDKVVHPVQKKKTITSRASRGANSSKSEATLELANPSESGAILELANPSKNKATLDANPSESKATLVANRNESEATLVANPSKIEALRYNYSTIPFGYTDLDLLYEVFDI
jgi:hypothetical protein